MIKSTIVCLALVTSAGLSAADELGNPLAVADHERVDRCEVQARALLPEARERAWEWLHHCVDAGYFTSLRTLLAGAWDAELQARPDALPMLAHVVAMRGGNVGADLALLHEKRIPIFSLEQAMAQPEVYRGRLVLVRARFAASSSDGRSLKLVELAIGNQSREVEVAPILRDEWKGRTNEGWSPRAGEPGDERQRGDRGERTRTVTVRRSYNVDLSTGRWAVGQLAQPDPFLDLGGTFVLLARFDGLSADDGGAPLLTIVDHQRPHALVMY